MRTFSIDTLKQELDAGIRNRLCVQAWLGHGEVLFLGFGDEVIPPISPGQRHPTPPYELQTEFADWKVEERGEVRGTGDDPREQAVDACEALVGHRAIDWHLDDTRFHLTIRFDSDLCLEVLPLVDEDVLGHSAWMLLTPAHEYFHVRCGGDLIVLHENEPDLAVLGRPTNGA
jgi:hypothetical protein